MDNKIGCRIDPNAFGLFDLTVTEENRTIVIVRNVSLQRAAAIFDSEVKRARKERQEGTT